jgi:L-amino acid N-acyltransferase YncA
VQAICVPIVRDSAISFAVHPPSVDDMQRRITATLARRPWLVCERGGEILGCAYASRHHERAAYRWGST